MANDKNDRFADYVNVSERITQFYSDHPSGRILTAIVEHDREAGFICMRAEVFRDSEDTMPSATGHAFEVRSEGYVNKTSYLENCETGAVGRALANLNFKAKQSDSKPLPTMPDNDAELDKAIRAQLARVGKAEAAFQKWFEEMYESDSKWTDMSIQIKQDILMKARTWKKR